MNFFSTNAEAQGLGNDENPFIILFLQELCNFNEGFRFELLQAQVVD